MEFCGLVSDHRSAKAEGQLQFPETGWAPQGPQRLGQCRRPLSRVEAVLQTRPCGQSRTAALRPPASPGGRTGAVPAQRGFCSPRAGVDPAGQRPDLSRRHSRSENRRGLRARWTSRCSFSGLRGKDTGWDPGWPAELGGLQAPVWGGVRREASACEGGEDSQAARAQGRSRRASGLTCHVGVGARAEEGAGGRAPGGRAR